MKQVKGNQQIESGVDVYDVMQPVNYVWRRMPEETTLNYKYFKAYLMMPTPRSMERVGKQLRLKTGNSLRAISGKFRWLERAAAYDDHYAEKQLEEKRKLKEKLELVWLERREVQRQQEWDIAQQLLVKVRQMLAVPLFQETISTKMKGLDAHGRIILEQVIINKPLDWSPSDIAKFFEVASKIARLATGQETDRKKIKIDFSKISDDELEALIMEN